MCILFANQQMTVFLATSIQFQACQELNFWCTRFGPSDSSSRDGFSHADMPGALVADEMGLEKTFTSVATAMLCKLVIEKVVMGLPLSIVWGNTLEE